MNNSNIINNITSNLSIRITLSFMTIHDKDWHEQKTKMHYTLWNILSGKIWVHIDNTEFLALPGDIVFFYPGNKYTAHTEMEGCKFLVNLFKVEMGNGIDILSGMNLAGVIPKEVLGDRCVTFSKQFMELYSSEHGIPFKLYSIFTAHLSDIIDAGMKDKYQRFNSDISNRAESDLQSIMLYIRDHFTENLSIKELAEMAGMSDKYFISCFKNYMGLSPKQYIIQCRMQLAARLLSDSNLKINEIALLVGYPDQYTFSKAFKKYFEEPPSVFKNHYIY